MAQGYGAEGNHRQAGGRRGYTNPFKIPDSHTIFTMRSEEKKRRQQARSDQHNLSVHEKTTYSSQLARARLFPSESDGEEDPVVRMQQDRERSTREIVAKASASIRQRHGEKENLGQYLKDKREMFLLQYSLAVKRDEMRKLEEEAIRRESAVHAKADVLATEALKFDEFLKETSALAEQAQRDTDHQLSIRMDKLARTKKLRDQIVEVNKKIEEYQRNCAAYMKYKDFLVNVIPSKDRSASAAGEESAASVTSGAATPATAAPSTAAAAASPTTTGTAGEADDVVQFQDPQQLLDVFTQLEETNLWLIQNGQEMDEALEKVAHTDIREREDGKRELQELRLQIADCDEKLRVEDERLTDLVARKKYFLQKVMDDPQGGVRGRGQPHLLEDEVRHIYQACFKDEDGKKHPLAMLTDIEAALEKLIAATYALGDRKKVQTAFYLKEKARKDEKFRLKKDRLTEEQLLKKEKHLLAAQREAKKKVGKPVMARSFAGTRKKKQEGQSAQDIQDELDRLYFFA